MNDFITFKATHIGRDHRRPFGVGSSNNQDGMALVSSDSIIVGVVCDGCGSGESSEVGAKLFAPIIANYLFECAKNGLITRKVLIDTEKLIVDKISYLSNNPQDVEKFFLFTIIAFIIREDISFIISYGDGMYLLNNIASQIDQNNTPKYIGYKALSDNDDHFIFETIVTTESIQTLAIATDGASEVDIAEMMNKCTNNSLSLQRQLNIIGRTSVEISDGQLIKSSGSIVDDTTIIGVKRCN
ncbi:MAG: protein phosphatase 2C domain-containing protein [Candidimonas sp.]